MSLFYSIATEGVNSGFKAMALMGYSASNFSITYTPSGGLIIDGVAIYHPVRSFSFVGLGNILTSGAGYYNQVHTFTYAASGLVETGGDSVNLKVKVSGVDGGANIRGTALRSKEKVVLGLGGLTSSGAGLKSLTRTPQIILNTIITGGSSLDSRVKTPRITPTPISFFGDSIVEKIKSVSMSGGALLSGSSYKAKLKEYVGLGDFYTTGQGTVAIGKSYQTVLSAVIVDGSTLISKLKTPYIRGGVSLTGLVETVKIKDVVPTTGFALSGSSYNVKTKYYDQSGGTTLSGGESYSKNTIWTYYVVVDGVDLAGEGALSKTKVIRGVLSVGMAGSASVAKVKDLVGTAGFVLSGSSTLLKVKDFISTGHVSSGGYGEVSKVKNLVGTLQVFTGGTGTLQYIKTYGGTSSVTMDGTGQILKIKISTSDGGVNTSGYAIYKDWPLRSTIYVNEVISKQSTLVRHVEENHPEKDSSSSQNIENRVESTGTNASKINRASENNRTSFVPSSGKRSVGKQGINLGTTNKPSNTVTITKGSNKIKL